jgi:hypothetical protein
LAQPYDLEGPLEHPSDFFGIILGIKFSLKRVRGGEKGREGKGNGKGKMREEEGRGERR